MKIYDIVRELKDRRAIIAGEYKELPLDEEVVVRDSNGVLYDAKVATRCNYGMFVVRVVDVV